VKKKPKNGSALTLF